MIITYWERGPVYDFKRRDTLKKERIIRYYEHGNLLYCYRDRYNIFTVAKEDICNVEYVDCYITDDGQTATVYRPNPNAKNVYIPYNYLEMAYKIG